MLGWSIGRNRRTCPSEQTSQRIPSARGTLLAFFAGSTRRSSWTRVAIQIHVIVNVRAWRCHWLRAVRENVLLPLRPPFDHSSRLLDYRPNLLLAHALLHAWLATS